jgi:4-carboxymuconolactone decarboxylase
MTHIAIQEAPDGKVVDWMEQVSDEQYRAKPGASEEEPPRLNQHRDQHSDRSTA